MTRGRKTETERNKRKQVNRDGRLHDWRRGGTEGVGGERKEVGDRRKGEGRQFFQTTREVQSVTQVAGSCCIAPHGRRGSVVQCSTCKREIAGSIAGWAEFAVDAVLLEKACTCTLSTQE